MEHLEVKPTEFKLMPQGHMIVTTRLAGALKKQWAELSKTSPAKSPTTPTTFMEFVAAVVTRGLASFQAPPETEAPTPADDAEMTSELAKNNEQKPAEPATPVPVVAPTVPVATPPDDARDAPESERSTREETHDANDRHRDAAMERRLQEEPMAEAASAGDLRDVPTDGTGGVPDRS